MFLIDITVAAFSYLVAAALLPRLGAMLAAGGLSRPNYLGTQIPVAVGVVLPLAALPGIILWLSLAGASAVRSAGAGPLALAFVLIGMASAGLLDDAVGNGSQRGLQGHLRVALTGKLTTGGCKVLLGGLVSLLAAATLPGRGVWGVLLAGAVIALAANFVNLCDLRPGRALKIFGVGYLLVAAAAGTLGGPYLTVLAAALALAPWDLQAKVMMGDTGANALGAALGLFIVEQFSSTGLAYVLALLVVAHLAAERWSFSRVIACVPLLQWLDMLGRKR